MPPKTPETKAQKPSAVPVIVDLKLVIISFKEKSLTE